MLKKFGIFLFILLFLTGCGKNTAGSDEETERFTFRSIVFGCYSESGILYEKDGILCFVDYATGEDVVFCTNPNCVHAPYSAVNNPDPYCDAALPWEDRNVTMIYGDRLYAFVTNFDSTTVYEKGVSESEWKKLTEMPYSYYEVVSWFACNDRIYYVADQFARQEDGILALDDAIFLAYVDLTDGTYGSLTDTDEETGTIRIVSVDQQNLYYEMHYKLDIAVPEDQGQVYRMDLETLKSEPVFRMEENRRFVGMHGDDLYYMESDGLHRTDAGGEDVCIYQGSDPNVNSVAILPAASGFLLEAYMADTDQFRIVYLDYESDRITEIERPNAEGLVVEIVGENVLVSGDAVEVIRLSDFLAGKEKILARHELN